MTKTEIKIEMRQTKKMMNHLLNCVKAGKRELYRDYTQTAAYYYKLSKNLELMK